MARAKKAVNHDAHVTEYWHAALDQIAAPAAPVAEAPAPVVELPVNVTLAEALAESGESMADLQDAPAVQVKRERRVQRTGDLQLSEEMLAKVRDGMTRQGHGLNLGKAWYKAGVMAPSIRHAALEALCNAADEDGNLPMARALEALKPLKEAGLLGCSTPASRISKFIRSGHLLEA